MTWLYNGFKNNIKVLTTRSLKYSISILFLTYIFQTFSQNYYRPTANTSLIYNATKIAKTYACKNAIKSSKNKIAVTTSQGNTPANANNGPELIKAQEKPINIFKSACPLNIFANNRMLKLKTLEK